MKHRKLRLAIIILFVIGLVLLLLWDWYKGQSQYAQFDLASEGLIQASVTKEEPDKTTGIQYLAVADGPRLMTCDPFEADAMTVYYVPMDCFESYIDREANKVLNRLVYIEIQDEEGNRCNSSPVIDDIFHQIALLEHDLFTLKIYDVSGEYFVYVELNVNWWLPCSLYYYNQIRGELIPLYTLSDQETTGVHVLSTDRLHDLSVPNQRKGK